MRTDFNGFATYVAMALAAFAAILSTPDLNGKTEQTLEWIGSSMGPEEALLAGAIGELPNSQSPP